jgi:hypothetical protein
MKLNLDAGSWIVEVGVRGSKSGFEIGNSEA